MNRKWLLCMGLALAALLGACDGSQDAGQARTETAPPAPVAPVPAAAESPAVDASRASPVLEQELAYGEGAKSNLVGYLAMPGDAAEPLPGLIVIHESVGLNEEVKAVTRRLAAAGYVALAVDLYGGVTAETPERAQELLTELFADPDAVRHNLRQAYDYLDKYAFAPRIAALGWDLGAGWSLQTGLMLPDALDAVVMYYGQVVTRRDDLATLKMPILGFFGAEDASVPARQVQEFRSTLMDLGKNVEVLIVSGVGHGFASPSSRGYDERAASESWAQTLEFLERHLKLSASAR